MKRNLVYALILAVLALVAFGAGSVLAQGQQPPYGGMMMGGQGMGWTHDLMEKALAAKLGITEQQVEDAFAAGKKPYQIAQDAGIPDADIPSLLTAVHKDALQDAVKAGYLTQAQADRMIQRMQNRLSDGTPGNCPMHNGSGRLRNNGAGFRGGMMGNW